MDYKVELSEARERWAYWSGQYNDLAAAYHTDITALESELAIARAQAEALRRENAALRARLARDAEDAPITPERAREIAAERCLWCEAAGRAGGTAAVRGDWCGE